MYLELSLAVLRPPTPGPTLHLAALQTLAALLAAQGEAANRVTCDVTRDIGHAASQCPELDDLGGAAQHPVGVVLFPGVNIWQVNLTLCYQ